MRIRAIVLVALGVLLAVVGCSKQVTGAAVEDPSQPPLALSEDGFGIAAGFDDAPVRIEIFTEPQCTHCADLQADFGDQLAYYIRVGQLKVTYRPLTFLDTSADGHSAKVANAMFLSAGGDATGAQFQRFVQDLWEHQEPYGPGPSDQEMADMAMSAGMSSDVATRIAGGESAVNIADMDDANFQYLMEIDTLDTGTPTVYDPVTDEKLDIYDNDWLIKLIQS
ncbi:DsbA family protein [Mycobacterium deserti]|uniref:DsbA family protein n=1 Tax=Mycobacterium deserti TaxID=2978347 RepID=A0ABT2M828_9MYCO|nr:DsbA family protein [Mycobacterium deserti]MCT7658423.1 DsbA family protein [Mycobacterium deserti]